MYLVLFRSNLFGPRRATSSGPTPLIGSRVTLSPFTFLLSRVWTHAYRGIRAHGHVYRIVPHTIPTPAR